MTSAKANAPKCATGASSVNFRYLLLSLRSSSSCWSLLPCLLVCSIFSSITCFSKQFPRKMYPIQSALLRSNLSRIFLSCLPLCNTSLLTRSVQLTEELDAALHLLQDSSLSLSLSLSPAVLQLVSVRGSSRNDIHQSLLISLNWIKFNYMREKIWHSKSS